MTVLATGPVETNLFRMRMILIGLRSEMRGMRLTRKGPSCFKIAKTEFGLKGTKAKILEQFQALVEEASSEEPVQICPVTGTRICE